MNEVSQPDDNLSMQPSRRHRLRWAIRIVAWSALIVTVVVCAQMAWNTLAATAHRDSMPALTTRAMGLIAPTPKRLSVEFTDTQGRLLADPPKTEAGLADPATLVVAHIKVDEADGVVIPWEQFDKHLAAVTGKPVEDTEFENTPDQIAEIKKGKITIVALHAAEAPFLVNNCGFQPQAVFGDESGVIGNHVDLLVPPDSPLTKAADIRGRSLVCTIPSSITGYRAAVALLMKNEGLRPNVDYTITWSLSQKKSINGVAIKKSINDEIKKPFPAAAVSDDKLQSMLRKGKIAIADYRIIYTSEVIPRTTIGWFYNLKPELAAKIREAIVSFRPRMSDVKSHAGESDSVDADSSDVSSKSLRFIPIDYKKDFELVRLIDDSFDPRLGGKPPKAAHKTEPPATQHDPAPGAF